MKTFLLLLAALGSSIYAADTPAPARPKLPQGAADLVYLWPNGAPGSDNRRNEPETVEANGNVANVHNPSLTIFLPPAGHETGAGVIVMPGGGHRFLVMEKEGYTIARWLTAHGIGAFVLKYRLAKEPSSVYKVETDEVADASRALRLVRSRARDWHVDPAHVGVMGFSAGGELASLLGMRTDEGNPSAADPVDRQSAVPAFQALIYPGGAQNISPNPKSPPAFLAAGFQDRPDISQGLARAYLLFQNVSVPAELHIYAGVGHGFGLRPGPAEGWADRFRAWLEVSGLLNSRPHGH